MPKFCSLYPIRFREFSIKQLQKQQQKQMQLQKNRVKCIQKASMKKLKELAKKRGLTIKECCQSGHIQILGGNVVVNYWPNSKKLSAHIEGSKGGKRGVTPEQAIEMAFSAPPQEDYTPRKINPLGDDPRKRTPQEWAALNPMLKYAFTKREWEQAEFQE